jgi:hypothetical protein
MGMTSGTAAAAVSVRAKKEMKMGLSIMGCSKTRLVADEA